jgi:hypothetical protein
MVFFTGKPRRYAWRLFAYNPTYSRSYNVYSIGVVCWSRRNWSNFFDALCMLFMRKFLNRNILDMRYFLTSLTFLKDWRYEEKCCVHI